MKTAFVTGGCGYVGKTIVNEFIKKYDKIIIFERKGCDTSWINNSKINLIYGDITDKETITGIKQGYHIFHLAALGGARKERFEVYERINVDGTKNVFDASLKAGAEKFFFMSSISATGPGNNIPLTEETHCKPRTIYGSTKHQAENYIIEKSKNKITSVIFRAPLLYGPKPHHDSGIYNIVKAIKYPFYPVFGSGKNKIMLCSIKNLVSGIFNALDLNNKKANIFFIRDEEQISILELIRLLEEITKSKTKRLFLPKSLLYLIYRLSSFVSSISKRNLGLNYDSYKGAVSNSFIISIDKIKKRGYKPEHCLKEGFAKVVDSLK
jgi:UDP-glucose 4-epimerase|tara:strand:+ start:1873 stop:2844 length:972 start_codon:yes stop_codon:yes gene_type:complete